MAKNNLLSKTGKKILNPVEAHRKKEREKEKKNKKAAHAPAPAGDRPKDQKKPEGRGRHQQSSLQQNNVTLKLVSGSAAPMQSITQITSINESQPQILTKRKEDQYINYFENNPEAMKQLIEEKHRMREGKKLPLGSLNQVVGSISQKNSSHTETYEEPTSSRIESYEHASQANATLLSNNLALSAQPLQHKKEEKKLDLKFSYRSPFDNNDPIDPMEMFRRNQMLKNAKKGGAASGGGAGAGAGRQRPSNPSIASDPTDSSDPFFRTTVDEAYTPLPKKIVKPNPPEQMPQPVATPPQMNPQNQMQPQGPVVQAPPVRHSNAVIFKEAVVMKTPQTKMEQERAGLVPIQLHRKKPAQNPTTNAPSNPPPTSNSALSAFFSEISKLG